jgi:hypothetical protein
MPEYIVQVGVNFRKNGVWLSLYDVAVSLLRLQTPIDCIPHPYWMYTLCFSSMLRCCGWAYNGYTLMPEYIVQVLILDITTYLVKLHQSKGYNNYFKAYQLCAASNPFSEQSRDNNGHGSR